MLAQYKNKCPKTVARICGWPQQGWATFYQRELKQNPPWQLVLLTVSKSKGYRLFSRDKSVQVKMVVFLLWKTELPSDQMDSFNVRIRSWKVYIESNGQSVKKSIKKSPFLESKPTGRAPLLMEGGGGSKSSQPDDHMVWLDKLTWQWGWFSESESKQAGRHSLTYLMWEVGNICIQMFESHHHLRYGPRLPRKKMHWNQNVPSIVNSNVSGEESLWICKKKSQKRIEVTWSLTRCLRRPLFLMMHNFWRFSAAGDDNKIKGQTKMVHCQSASCDNKTIETKALSNDIFGART